MATSFSQGLATHARSQLAEDEPKIRRDTVGPNDPTALEKAALLGTVGGCSATNPYVVDADPRNTNARTPTVHGDAEHTPAYEKIANKGVANGYAGLDAGTKVPTAQMGGAGADSTKFLRGDQSWAVPSGGGGPRESHIMLMAIVTEETF